MGALDFGGVFTRFVSINIAARRTGRWRILDNPDGHLPCCVMWYPCVIGANSNGYYEICDLEAPQSS